MESSSSKNASLIIGDWNSTAKALGTWMMFGIIVKNSFYRGKKHKANSTSFQPMSGNGKISLTSLRENGKGNLKKIRRSPTPVSGSGYMKKGRRTPRLWWSAWWILLPLVSNFIIWFFLSQPNVTPLARTLDALENENIRKGKWRGFFMRLKSYTPIEVPRKMEKNREKR